MLPRRQQKIDRGLFVGADVVTGRTPSDPFKDRPRLIEDDFFDVGRQLPGQVQEFVDRQSHLSFFVRSTSSTEALQHFSRHRPMPGLNPGKMRGIMSSCFPRSRKVRPASSRASRSRLPSGGRMMSVVLPASPRPP